VSLEQLVQRANNAFQNHLSALGERDFTRADNELQRLQGALQQLSEAVPSPPADANNVPQANDENTQ
jgi:hypothetical protein